MDIEFSLKNIKKIFGDSGLCGRMRRCEVVDWINLAQGRDRWLAPVKTVAKLVYP
jgi:hypothetical protein